MQKFIRIYLYILVLFSNLAYADCYSISNADVKNHCLAKTKSQSGYCYSIKENDLKNFCLAEALEKSSYCYNIKSRDKKNHCLAILRGS